MGLRPSWVQIPLPAPSNVNLDDFARRLVSLKLAWVLIFDPGLLIREELGL